ncbi:MAG: FAD-dependent monooxygenase [Pseudomonadota bacterium]
MIGDSPFSALVIGGSVGGLAAAIELRDRLGADVSVFERSAHEMQARGAGVVMQPEVDALLNRIGVTTRSVCVELRERVTLSDDGHTDARSAPQLMTAWDTLYRVLRNHLGDRCYRPSSEFTELEQNTKTITASFADGHMASADLLVGADGVNSAVRESLSGSASATYSGYVAWRGLESEAGLPGHLVEDLRDRFTSYMKPGMQMLCYLVPGADGSIEHGKRRVNWVWYVNTPADQLARLMTGGSGRHYRSFLPPGDVAAPIERALQDFARQSLPPLFRDLVAASTLFMQPVQDVAHHQRIHGRALLIGDAAGTVRPHTASGTSKAFGDAAMLANALREWTVSVPLPANLLAHWAETRNADLNATALRGRRLAAASGLGPVA